MSSTDGSLVIRVRDGDEAAAVELYQRYAARVFGLVRTQMAEHLRAQTEPEDIVQSIFKSVFRGMNAGNYTAPPGGTLWHLMAVIAVNKVRRNARQRMAGKRDDRRTESIDAEELSVVADRPSMVQMESAISEAIECLKPSEREVVVLRVRGFSIEEIASQTQRSRRTVERLLQHARETLASQLLDSTEQPQSENMSDVHS
ncbi:MAG: sigma-70 family RNA polymerase sigma factor [Pirellulaceae bacterium]|nr:sigma-70 family RNA polymerase sigma factor [Pirellulaceae bacterium]